MDLSKFSLYFHRFCNRVAKTYGRKRGTECKFSARVKGDALAAVQRQSAGRAKRETITPSFTLARVRAGW